MLRSVLTASGGARRTAAAMMATRSSNGTQHVAAPLVSVRGTAVSHHRGFYSGTHVLSKKKEADVYTEEDTPTPPGGPIEMLNTEMSQTDAEAIIAGELEKIRLEAERKLYKDWKPGERKRELLMSYNIEDFDEEAKKKKWYPQMQRRCGALGIKIGMMPVWDDWGERHACTVLFLDNNVVLKNKTEDTKDGYNAVQIGAGERKMKRVTKPLMGHYKACGITEHPPFIVREFRVSSPEYMLPPGTVIHARHFIPGQNVDVAGISKGKGFQGAMKRHGFAGMPATHGTSLSHRALGSTGQCQDPGKVFKGKKMAGRMGSDRVTVQNLRIVKVDRGRNLLYVKGAIPGNKGGFVEIRDAVKKPLFGTEKIFGADPQENSKPPLPTYSYEEGIDGSGESGHEEWMPLGKKDPMDPNYDLSVA
uniref:Large ribosomal subunit protein uL3m n=1 Tax=Attheya septentrionalis TaxID=420275 RepID=A0A7S2UC97_9STRA|mmetsp:Transcript_17812/g.32244  ORF Transcript_17812/g.32244 Transcript_17812/m.32244 type:complete len:419 (+) Transcript_17812:32-1288(+)